MSLNLFPYAFSKLNIRRLLSVLSLILFFSLASMSSASEPIDLNSADVKTLATLKNIGKKKAQAIIEYREVNGKFQTVDDLTKVKGVGKDTLEANRTLIVAIQ